VTAAGGPPAGAAPGAAAPSPALASGTEYLFGEARRGSPSVDGQTLASESDARTDVSPAEADHGDPAAKLHSQESVEHERID
jgi:hypothetical protein